MIPGGWCILDSLVKLPNTLELNMKVRDCQPLQVEKGNSPNEKDFEQTNKITYIYDIHSALFWGIKHSFAEGLTLLLTLTNNKKSKTQNMSEHLAISKYKALLDLGDILLGERYKIKIQCDKYDTRVCKTYKNWTKYLSFSNSFS